LIAEPGKPERPAVFDEAHGVILVNWDAHRLERAAGDRRSPPFALYRAVVPIIVIAEDRVHAERRLQSSQHRCPFRRRNVSRHMSMPGQ